MISKLVKGIVLGLAFVGAVNTVNASNFDVVDSAADFSNKKVGDVFTVDLNDKDVVNKLVSDHVAIYITREAAENIENKMNEDETWSIGVYGNREDNIDGKDVIVRESSIVKHGPRKFVRTENGWYHPSVLGNDKMLVLMDFGSGFGLKDLVESEIKSITYKNVQCTANETKGLELNVLRGTGIVITGIN